MLPYEKTKALYEVAKTFEWGKWQKEIPFIQFPSSWKVKAIPPFITGIIRYCIEHSKQPGSMVSVYLDCYDQATKADDRDRSNYPCIQCRGLNVTVSADRTEKTCPDCGLVRPLSVPKVEVQAPEATMPDRIWAEAERDGIKEYHHWYYSERGAEIHRNRNSFYAEYVRADLYQNKCALHSDAAEELRLLKVQRPSGDEALLREALEGLSRCYDVVEYPGDGSSFQDGVIKKLKERLKEGQ